MVKAIWNSTVIAESDQTEVVENNHYFPPETIKKEYFRENKTKTVCGWKGVANYYDIIVDDHINPGAAWYYPDPKPAAENIKDHIAFWRGVVIED